MRKKQRPYYIIFGDKKNEPGHLIKVQGLKNARETAKDLKKRHKYVAIGRRG